MSDDLVKRLRAFASPDAELLDDSYRLTKMCHQSHEAADRIEELEKAFANMQREYDKRGDHIKELEAKLKPALAALGDIGNGEPEWPDDPQKELDWCRNRANEALAKIKREQP